MPGGFIILKPLGQSPLANRYRYPITVHALYIWFVLAEIGSNLFLVAWLKLRPLAVALIVFCVLRFSGGFVLIAAVR